MGDGGNDNGSQAVDRGDQRNGFRDQRARRRVGDTYGFTVPGLAVYAAKRAVGSGWQTEHIDCSLQGNKGAARIYARRRPKHLR